MDLQEYIEYLYESTNENIVGVSLGYKTTQNIQTEDIAICFKVKKKLPLSALSPEDIIPSKISINNILYKTDIIEGNNLKLVLACQITNPNQHTALIRPLLGGVSVTNGDDLSFYVGTMGALVRDNEDDSIVGLTNAHVVIADSFVASEKPSEYNIRDKNVTQPALGDISSLEDIPFSTIGETKRYYPVSSSSPNYVDAALIHIKEDSLLNNNSNKVLGLDSNLPFATTQEIDSLLSAPKIKLFKSGRTTGAIGGQTCDIVTKSLNFVGSAPYPKIDGSQTSITISDCIEFSYEDFRPNVCVPGDSGSVLIGVFNGVNKIVGLVFATDNYVSGDITKENALGYANRIDRLANMLNISSWNGAGINISNKNDWEYIEEEGTEDQVTINRNGKTYWQVGTL